MTLDRVLPSLVWMVITWIRSGKFVPYDVSKGRKQGSKGGGVIGRASWAFTFISRVV